MYSSFASDRFSAAIAGSSDSQDPELYARLRDAIAQLPSDYENDELFRDRLLTWVVDRFLHGSRYERYIVDRGYDISDGVQLVGKGFEVADYRSVTDFLQEPNGNIMPTFVSGSGLAAEDLETDLENYLRDLLAEWAEPWNFNDDEDDQFWDWIADESLGYAGYWRNILENTSLAEAIAKYRIPAEEMELARQEEERQWREKQRKQDAIADSVARQFVELGGELYRKYEMKAKQNLLQLLDMLCQSLGDCGPYAVACFVRSNYLHTSNRLAQIIQAKYPLV